MQKKGTLKADEVSPPPSLPNGAQGLGQPTHCSLSVTCGPRSSSVFTQ